MSKRNFTTTIICSLAAAVSFLFGTQSGFAQGYAPIRFAVLGDYGLAGQPLTDVSNLIKSWNPDFVMTTGDNNYPDGGTATIDKNIGQYFAAFINPYTGAYGSGATVNRFFPTLGNHDWHAAGASPYINYFNLPGNERYYDFIRGPVHFFAIDSDGNEPDGNSAGSTQAAWLQSTMSASSLPFKVVYFHHPPYSSARHGSSKTLQWNFAGWGATAVLSGHDHTYERIQRDGIVYFVCGLGGKSIYNFNTPVSGSQVRYNGDYGAMLVDANQDSILFRFYNRGGQLIDSYTVKSSVTAIKPAREQAIPQKIELAQNYPNPFNPSTTIRFTLPRNQHVRLTIYSAIGQVVTRLLDQTLSAGDHFVRWNGRNQAGRPVGSGVYFYELQSAAQKVTRRMLLAK